MNAGGFFLAAIPFAPLFILHDYLHSVPSHSEQGQNQLASRIALLEEDRADIARNLINVNLRGFHPPVSRDKGIGSEI